MHRSAKAEEKNRIEQGPSKVLQEGSTGEFVRVLEKKLKMLGYMPTQKPDGVFTHATTQAVMAFQGWEGLSRDGIVGPVTWGKIIDPTTKRARLKEKHDGKWVYADLHKQILILVDNHKTQAVMHFSSGKPGYSTPTGEFQIYRREIKSWSNPYEVWMPYAQYFTGGIAFHEASYVPQYPDSHGCLRLIQEQAKYLWNELGYGNFVKVVNTA